MSTWADPAVLAGYAGSADRLDEALHGLAQRLADVADPRSPWAAEAWSLHQRIRTLARREAATTRWVRSVGVAFERADRGVTISPAAIDVLVDLAQPDQDVAVAALSLRFLQGIDAGPAAMAGAAEAMGPRVLRDLTRVYPDLVGPVDGFPEEARYEANRLLVATAAAEASDPVRRRRLAALLADDASTGRPRQILLFDPVGDGRVVEAFGDLDAASSIAVVVPGAGTDLDGFDRNVSRPVGDLARRADAAALDGSVASIAWLGYDPPDGAVVDGRELLALASSSRAEAGGRALDALVTGLRLDPSQRVTLIGHSYGSTTVGAALLRGVRADNVVVMGSPGILVDHADDFGRTKTDFFVMAAPGDPIAHLGWFGADPSRSGSGFERLAVDGSGHSSYLVSGSLAQQELVAVINDGPVHRFEG